jgi:hypothetical protein
VITNDATDLTRRISAVSKLVSISEGKITLYFTPDSNVYVDVVFKDETFWATQKIMAELFDTSTDNISMQDWLNEADNFLKNNRRNYAALKYHAN